MTIGPKKVKSIIVFVFLVVGIVFSFVIPNSLQKLHDRCTMEIPATIIDIEANYDDDGATTYAPVYELEIDGILTTRTPNVYTSTRPTIGDEVTLMVNPYNTNEFYDPIRDSELLKIFRIIGYFFLGLSVVVFFIRGRN